MLRPTTSQQYWRPLLAFASVAVILTAGQHWALARGTTSPPERLCQALSKPALKAFTALHGLVEDVAISVVSASALRTENRLLRERCARLEADKTLLTEHRLENKRLKEKLGLSPEQEVKDIPAWVVARTGDSQRCRITIKVLGGGEVHEGDIVKEAGGLVGRVIEVVGDTAQVILLVDQQHAVAGVDQRSRDEGMIYPLASLAGLPRRLRMEKLRRQADLRAGDVILTSRLGGVYPPNMPIGTIESVRRSPASIETVTAIIKPFVDFSHLDYVWVVSKP